MIVNCGKYYLYRYIREDKNQPFYIGIGTKYEKKVGFRSYKSEYHRAVYKHDSPIFNKVKNKTAYNIEILLESNDYDFIKKKEIEFIKLYGRIDIGTGTLVNLTDGGEGAKGIKLSEKTRQKISQNNPIRGKFGKNHHNSKKVYQYDIEGNFIKEWQSLADIGRVYNKNKRIPSFKGKTYKGYQWFYEFKGEKINKVDYTEGIERRLKKIKVSVYQYDINYNFINKYDSITEASVASGISISVIHASLSRKNHICRDYIFTKELINNHVNS